MRARAWQGYLAVGLLVTGAAWVLPTVVRAAPMASRIGCYELLSAAAVAAIVLGMWWHRPGVRLPWVLFAGAQLAYFAGDVTFYTYQQLLHDARFPAPADGLYLAHYPLFVAGLLLLLRRRSPGRYRDGLLDALIVTTGVGLLAWVFVLGPYVRTAGLSLPVRAVSLAYPLMDLLVVAVAARLAVAGGARPPAYWLLLSGLPKVLSVSVGEPGRAVGCGGGQQLGGAALAEEGMDLADPPGHGQRRRVRQGGLERAPDALDRVVVGAVARPVQHPHPRVGCQPPLDDLGVVDDHVVADHRHHRRGRVGGQQLFTERGEAGADRLAADLVAEPAAGQVDRAEDGPPPVGPRGHDLLAAAVGDPGRAHPRQQVDVRLVLGQHHRVLGQFGDGLAQRGEDLVAVGVALGDQPRPPPGRHLADASVQGVQADGRAAQVQVQQRDGPGPRLGQEPADASTQPPATEPGSARPGPVGKAVGAVGVVPVDPAAHGARVAAQQLGDGGRRPAVLGQQDHDQAAADPVRAVQQPEQVAWVASRAGALGVHAGGTHTGAAS